MGYLLGLLSGQCKTRGTTKRYELRAWRRVTTDRGPLRTPRTDARSNDIKRLALVQLHLGICVAGWTPSQLPSVMCSLSRGKVCGGQHWRSVQRFLVTWAVTWTGLRRRGIA